MKKVESAAIRAANGSLHRGQHHDEIKVKGTKGFVLSDGQFVDRTTAAKVAVAAGQAPATVKSLKSHQLTGYGKKKEKLGGI